TAKKAWFIAGLFEWPIMAFMGIALGLFARVGYEQGLFTAIGYAPGTQLDAELGLPLFLRTILPVGLMGLMLSAYFSAIMSTADSCLMAASGNFTTDILEYFKGTRKFGHIKYSQIITLIIGALAIILATNMQNVLELMLYSYAFMVSGLLVPVLGTLLLKEPSARAAVVAMVVGGLTTLILIITQVKLPFGLDANFFGIAASFISFVLIQY